MSTNTLKEYSITFDDVMNLISTDTKQSLFLTLFNLPADTFTKELKVLIKIRKIYLKMHLENSCVLAYLDSVYSVFCDVLVDKYLNDN